MTDQGQSGEGGDPPIEEDSGAADRIVCFYGGKTYSAGSYLCIEGTKHECMPNGTWRDTGFSCDDEEPPEGV